MSRPTNSNRGDDERRPTTDAGGPYYVLSSGPTGRHIARRLREAGHTVRMVDESRDDTDLPATQADPTDVAALEAAGLPDGATVVVATRSDRRNFLAAQLVSAKFDVPRVVVLANTPERLDAFEQAGHDPVCAASVLSEEVLATL